MPDLYMNIGMPTIAGRGFVALAIEAGITNVIPELLSGMAMDIRTLTLATKDAVKETDPDLAAALNTDNILLVIDYIYRLNGSVMKSAGLPLVLLEDGPAEVSAEWDANPGQINVTYTAPPRGYTGEIYLDAVYWKHSTEAPVEGYVTDSVVDVPPDVTKVRVLYRSPDGNLTRFGPIAELLAR